jgi:hypothetical protein
MVIGEKEVSLGVPVHVALWRVIEVDNYDNLPPKKDTERHSSLGLLPERQIFLGYPQKTVLLVSCPERHSSLGFPPRKTRFSWLPPERHSSLGFPPRKTQFSWFPAQKDTVFLVSCPARHGFLSKKTQFSWFPAQNDTVFLEYTRKLTC